jgi:hypothetical protein
MISFMEISLRFIASFTIITLLVLASWPTKAANPGMVVVNEIAWMGTRASSNDEWIELYNNTDQSIDLSGWMLIAEDGTPTIELSGTIESQSYFLLERTDDATVRGIEADLIYSGALSNEGETLTLTDSDGNTIDHINAAGIEWPAGTNDDKRSMERIDPLVSDIENWATFNNTLSNGNDADNQPMLGTPKARNSVSNRLPVCTDAQADAAPGVAIELDLLLRCTDDDALSFGIDDMPDHGSLQCNEHLCTYTADDGYIGEDRITFSADDGSSQRTLFTILIIVGGGSGSTDAVFFVESVNGSDTNDGLNAARPLASISAAIEKASDHAKIIVLGGVYSTPLIIDKPLTLEAVSATTIDVNGQTAITIQSDKVNIIGLSIQNAEVGIQIVAGVKNIQIKKSALVSNNVAVNNQSGISVEAVNVWWGCNVGPNQAECDQTSGPINAAPWLVVGLNAMLTEVPIQTDASFIVDLAHNSQGDSIANVLSRPVTIKTKTAISSLELPNQSTIANELWSSMVTLAVLMLMTDWRKTCGVNAKGLVVLLCCLMTVGLTGCDTNDESSVTQTLIKRQTNHGQLRFSLTSETPQTLSVDAVVDRQNLISIDIKFLPPA